MARRVDSPKRREASNREAVADEGRTLRERYRE